MDNIFICPQCGKINRVSEDDVIEKVIKRELICDCNTNILMENSYPPLAAQDFVHSVSDMQANCEDMDTSNLKNIQEILSMDGWAVDTSELKCYVQKYEEILEKFPHNDRNSFIPSGDEFEEYLLNKLPAKQAIQMISVLSLYRNNRLRKPIVVMVAAALEQLFHDYFRMLLCKRIGDTAAQAFLTANSYEGIRFFTNKANEIEHEALKSKMNKYSKRFYQKWRDLRWLRNAIIHSNDKFVSRSSLCEILKMLDAGITVFSNLKSELYAES